MSCHYGIQSVNIYKTLCINVNTYIKSFEHALSCCTKCLPLFPRLVDTSVVSLASSACFQTEHPGLCLFPTAIIIIIITTEAYCKVNSALLDAFMSTTALSKKFQASKSKLTMFQLSTINLVYSICNLFISRGNYYTYAAKA